MIDIDNILKGFKNLNILIVGDVMIDRYLKGKVNRISPEAPVPVVELQQTEDRLGGAANVALNIKALGATPYLYSIIGEDTEGVIFLKLMNESSLPIRGILAAKERKTTIKTRIMAGTQQMLRVDSEMTNDISESLQQVFIKKIQELIESKNIHAIIFQDYNKGILTVKVIREITLMAIKSEIPTIVDPKKNNFLEYRHTTLFKPNLKEIRDSVPFEVIPEPNSLKKASDYLRGYLGHKYTMITLSDKGLYWESNDEDKNSLGCVYPTKTRNISDVSGAGDTVVSIAALGIASGLDKSLIAKLSNVAGGQVCEVPGVVPVNVETLSKEIKLEQL